MPCTLAPTHTRDEPAPSSVRRLKSMRFLLVLTPTTDARTRTPTENRESSARSSSAASLDVSIVGIKVVIPGVTVTFNPSCATATTYASISSPTDT